MMRQQPRVKHSANLLGERMRVGSATVKASIKKKAPPARKLKKYTSCCPLGIPLHSMG
jgi:hypothetical protein